MCNMQLVLEMEGGLRLAFCDPRRFGRIRMVEDPANNEPVSKLGFDPILSMPDLEAFTAQLAKQRRAVKALILDQVAWALCVSVVTISHTAANACIQYMRLPTMY